MGYYPIFVDMAERPCLVVGGGAVAARKVEALLHVGAIVTIVNPTLNERIESWAKEGKIRHVAREYRAGDLVGYELVFVTTDDHTLNAEVAGDGKAHGVWVNAADDPAHCDFILPSVLRRGELVVAVATGGTSPALARAIREELEAYFTEEYAHLANIASEVRRELRGCSISPDAEHWRAALGPELRRLVAEGKLNAAKEHIVGRLQT